MKSNYKLLGNYIQEVIELNKGLEINNLKGISSIYKCLIESKANTIGVDFSTYKILRKGQFSYNPNTARMGDKIPIALNNEEDCIVSKIYPVFKIIKEDELLPEYLMMWFRRSEFDRYARFKSHGSAREVFSWEDMCNVKLPIPSIEKQREIVKEYNVVLDRITMNESILDKLESLALSIYKELLINLEPDRHENLVYNDETNQYIPNTWEIISVKDYCVDMKSGGTPNRGNKEFWNSNDVNWLKTGEIFNNIIVDTEEYISQNGLDNSSAKILPKGTVLMSMYGVNAGQLGILKIETSTNQACCGMICSNDKEAAYLYYTLLYNQEFISSQSIGGAQENLSKNFIENIKIVKPSKEIVESLNLDKIINYREVITKETKIGKEMLEVLLAKLANMGE